MLSMVYNFWFIVMLIINSINLFLILIIASYFTK